MKKASNAWIQDEIGVQGFAWQEGYAAFTISAPARDAVKEYIAHQEKRHQQVDFRGELQGMLEGAEIDFDAEYLC